MDVKTEGWRRLHNEELRDLYSAPNIIREIKTNEVGKGVGHVSRAGTGEVHTGFMLMMLIYWEEAYILQTNT